MRYKIKNEIPIYYISVTTHYVAESNHIFNSPNKNINYDEPIDKSSEHRFQKISFDAIKIYASALISSIRSNKKIRPLS
jgi:hypothetical protein